MVLEKCPPSAYNAMVGRALLKGKARSGKQQINSPERPTKRIKRFDPNHSDSGDGLSDQENETTLSKLDTSEGAAGFAVGDGDELPTAQRTDLEQALPPIKTDRDAIQEYENFRAAEGAVARELEERLGKRQWVKGKSSIYVDAFNLALETVLEDESHLFNEAEMHVFVDWRALSYEAQYLSVICPLWYSSSY